MHLSDERARSLRLCSNRATIESAGTGSVAFGRSRLSQHEIAAALKVKQRVVHAKLPMRLRKVTIARNRQKFLAVKKPFAGQREQPFKKLSPI